jgi:hypothetical protein
MLLFSRLAKSIGNPPAVFDESDLSLRGLSLECYQTSETVLCHECDGDV